MIVALDLETSCGVKNCLGYGLSNSSKCEHAVHTKLNKIDIIGVWDGKSYHNFGSNLEEFDRQRVQQDWKIITHSKNHFDLNTLRFKGSTIPINGFAGDTYLLAASIKQKVPPDWLKGYNEKRKELNGSLPPKQRHRPGTPYTLKTLAPFFLGVEPFWENPASHDDPGYNRKDCEYTYLLHEKLLGLADQDGVLSFYQNYLIPWSKLLAESQFEGVLVDEKLLHKMYAEACKELEKLEETLHIDLEPCAANYRMVKAKEIYADTKERLSKYIDTRLKDKTKAEGVTKRYEESAAEKVNKLPTRFNLQSSQQMLVICQHYGIDTNVEKRDKATNEWIEKEGTDKFVLKRAKVAGNPFAAKLLEYRNKETEVMYLKAYIEAVVDGRIYCTFSIVGTRTGRLSSSGPNLQNVKGSLRLPFIVADAGKYSIYTVDSSQIEPRVIAFLTEDKEMVTLFREGRDYHNYATKKFFPNETEGTAEADIKRTHEHLRKTAKIGDLSIIYGTGKHTFQTMCLVREEMALQLGDCENMVRAFRAGMEGPMRWKADLEHQYKSGYNIYDPFGFLVQPRDSQSVHMTLFNSYVQGMSSRMIFDASLRAYRHFRKNNVDAKPLIWVHDEVVWRFPKGMEDYCKRVVDAAMVSYKLETPHGRVPLGVEGKIAERWEK